MVISSKDAAKHLCRVSGHSLTNLEIQKILYIADMNYIGQTGERLISEPFEAWSYGPVLPSLYHDLKIFGSDKVKRVGGHTSDISNTPQGRIIGKAYAALKDSSARDLVRNTHWEEGAWATVYSPGSRHVKISDEAMKNEYKKRIERKKHRSAA